ncbi:MAG: ABC transporter substrate-binding protein [Deinococcales bacterium]
MKSNPVVPLLVLLLLGYGGYTLYQRGQLQLPGLPPVTPTSTAPSRTTPPPKNTAPLNNPAPKSSLNSPEIEPRKFVNPALRALFDQREKKEWAELLAAADTYRRKNPTDALAGLLREEAIVRLAKADTYRIGVSAPLTGALRQVGEAFLQGVYLAVKEVNDSGGFLRSGKPYKLTVRVLNDAGDRAMAIKVASEFIGDNYIWGIIGPYSSSTLLAAAPIYNAASPGRPVIAPAATNPKITDAGRMIYRVAPSDATQGAALARLVQAKGAKSAAVLFDESDAYSLGLAQTFKAEAARIGLTTSDVPFSLNNYTQPRVGNFAVDAILVSGYTADVAAAARAEKPFGKPIYAGDGAYGQDLLAQGGAAVEGVTVTSFWHSTLTDPASSRFTRRFQNLFGGGTPNANAMQAYDATRALIEALRRMRSKPENGEGVRLALETLRDRPIEGITSPLRFDKNGDMNDRPWVAITVENGRFRATGYAR